MSCPCLFMWCKAVTAIGFLCSFRVRLCRFCVVIRFFHPRHNGQWPPTSKDFQSQIVSITFFSYLNSWERASISLFNVECQIRELFVPFYNVFGMTRSLTGDWTRYLPHSKPVLYHYAIEEAVPLMCDTDIV